MRTIIVGLGNPILTDDGVGVRVAMQVEEAARPGAGEELVITEASVGGLRLMELMEGFDRAIVIDAMTGVTPHTPGRIHKLTLDDLRNRSYTQHSASAHDTTLVTAMDAGKRMGMRLPTDIVIYGVEVENVIDFSEEPTPAVAQSIPDLTKAVLAEIEGGDE
jgi:hydrogenase maturation protease